MSVTVILHVSMRNFTNLCFRQCRSYAASWFKSTELQ